MAEFVGCGETYAFAWTIGIQRNQYVITFPGGGTRAIKVVRPHEHRNLDTVLFQLFGQIGNRITTNSPVFPEQFGGMLGLFDR
ncbi:hypothetical protein D3C87_2031080 [compost metagenome]